MIALLLAFIALSAAQTIECPKKIPNSYTTVAAYDWTGDDDSSYFWVAENIPALIQERAKKAMNNQPGSGCCFQLDKKHMEMTGRTSGNIYCASTQVAAERQARAPAPRAGAANRNANIVTASQVNGRWVRQGNNENGVITIKAIGGGKLQLSGEFINARGNDGAFQGVGSIDGTAGFIKGVNGQAECTITYSFTNGGTRLEVNQESQWCGFGNGVYASGTYVKQ